MRKIINYNTSLISVLLDSISAIIILIIIIIGTSFQQFQKETRFKPPCNLSNPCDECDIYMKFAAYQRGECSLKDYQDYENKRFEEIKNRCDSVPPPPPPTNDCSKCAFAYEIKGSRTIYKKQEYEIQKDGCPRISNLEKQVYEIDNYGFDHDNKYKWYLVITDPQDNVVLPFENGNYLAKQWKNGLTNCNLHHQFVFFAVNKTNNHVVRIQNKTSDYTTLIPNFPVEWLKKQVKESPKDKLIENICYELVSIAAFDPNFKIEKEDLKSKKRLIVSGEYNGRKYRVGIDRYNVYLPISKNLDSTYRQAIYASLDNSQNKAIYDKLIDEWYENGTEATIDDFLPSSWLQSLTPKDVLGGHSNLIEFDSDRVHKASAGADLSFLINHNGKTYLYPNKRELQDIDKFKNIHHTMKYLYVAGKVDTFATQKQNANVNKILFLFKNKKILWSWDIQGNNLNEKKLIDGGKVFAWTQQPVQPYLDVLIIKATQVEREFWLAKSDANAVEFFDWHTYKDDSRIVFCGKMINRSSWTVERGGSIVSKYDNMSVNLIGTGDIVSNYNGWLRNNLLETVYKNPGRSDVFISPKRFGYVYDENNDKRITIQSRQDCAIENKSWNTFNSKLRIIYTSSIELSINEAFEQWLLPNWNRAVWRANPLGLIASS